MSFPNNTVQLAKDFFGGAKSKTQNTFDDKISSFISGRQSALDKAKQSLKSVHKSAGDAYFNMAEPVKGQPIQNFAKSLVLTPKAESDETSRLLSSDFRTLNPQDKRQYVDRTLNYTMGMSDSVRGVKGFGKQVPLLSDIAGIADEGLSNKLLTQRLSEDTLPGISDELSALTHFPDFKKTPPIPEIDRTKLSGIQLGMTNKALRDLNFTQTADSVSTAIKGEVSRLPSITSDNALKHKVSFLDQFRTPDRVLEKIGLGNQAKELRTAHQNYVLELPKEIDKITQWWEKVGQSNESSRNIFRYLDGQKQPLSPVEKVVADEIKTYLSEWADRLKLPKDKRVSQYITHIFEDNFINKEFDPELEKIIANKIPGSVYDPFLQERLGKQGYVEDAFRVLDVYVKRATRKVNMDPALESLKTVSEDLPLQSWNYVKNYADRINLRPTELDNSIDTFIKQTPIGQRLGQRPTTRVLGKIRVYTNRASLGLNVGSALKNLTQGANTYAQLGERYTARGYFDATRAILGRDDELQRVGVLADGFIQDRSLSAKKQLLQKVDGGLWAMFDMAEKINRGSAYFGAKARALNEGKSAKEAVQAGIDMARKTQFTFGSVDTPAILQSDIAKTLLQFQSYNVKQLEFLGEMVKEKNVAGLVRYLAAWALFTKVGHEALGMDFSNSLPFSSEILKGESRIGKTPAIELGKGVLKTAVGAPGRFGEPAEENVIKRLQQQGVPNSLGSALIPGFVQGKKTLESVKTFQKGFSETQGGRVRFLAPESTAEKAQSLLFGQYANAEGRRYIDEEMAPAKLDTVVGRTLTDAFIADDKVKMTKAFKDIQKTSDPEATMVESLKKIAVKAIETKDQELLDRVMPLLRQFKISPSRVQTEFRNTKYSQSDKDKTINNFLKAMKNKDQELLLKSVEEAKAMGISPKTIQAEVTKAQFKR